MNAYANSYQKYRKHDVLMATPIELVVMLYNGCIKRLRLAQASIEKKDFEEANANLQRAQDIVMELVNGLDFQYPIASELMALYEFIHREIIRINMSKDAEAIAPLIDMLSGLRDAWAQVQKQQRGGSYLAAENE